MKDTFATRDAVIARATDIFDTGGLLATLRRRVAIRSESQEPAQAAQSLAYLQDEIAPALARLGFTTRLLANPVAAHAPLLFAERHEDPTLPTVLTYAHGDVVRGYEGQWADGRSPWEVTVDGDRWYGRGTADNKGQHTINLAALEAVIAARGGKLGFNLKIIVETGEEIDSPGLKAVCEAAKDTFAADLFLASDGPRVSADRPTVFLGSRGELNLELRVDLRSGAHHSGNWGGVLANPVVILSHAIASLLDARGRIAVEGLRPPAIPDAVRLALADIELGQDASSPAIDPDWGEPGLSPAERVVAWNAFEVLAIKAADVDAPIGAIPPVARAICQWRFVVGSDWTRVRQNLEAHLSQHGFSDVQVIVHEAVEATRLDPENPWVEWALRSIQRTTGKKPALLPNLGGTLPNAIFANVLKLPTVWVPHAYPACSQHAPNEHLLASGARESLALMAELWWDLGDIHTTSDQGAAGTTRNNRAPRPAVSSHKAPSGA
ncbi:M20 family metallopeptidase [Pigmentiphaga aceris]|uniref:M20 family metallopeptidase n=1 Tax=Pigmentiphaga aceris TaxID=1940612 RepID=A0A5C0B2C1_9BURK|nr:M20 family metallopeptidase [Pigmentiphaga aceris]QEI08066.1 M20 family metallopeptidase [Pigmentiphaga aceris]